MVYQRISSFPDDAASCGSSELKALATVWIEKRSELQETGVFKDFLRKLQREWAIETGIIERLYTWDRGVTEVLIEQGIDASLIAHRGGIQIEKAEHIKKMIDGQLSIVEGLFSFVKGEYPLTEHFIRGLHEQFTEHQDYTEALTEDGELIWIKLGKGKYKTLPNNPRRSDGEMHEYCPPEFTQEEMSQLIEWYRENESEMATEVRAAWLHHRFTQIHPFQDGNGRVARALASLVFLKDRLFPLVIRDADRVRYIKGLELADKGDMRPLVELFARRQKESILQALGLEQQAQQSKNTDLIISSALLVLKDKHKKEKKRLDRVYEYADGLAAMAEKRMAEIANQLDNQLVPVTPPHQDVYHAHISSSFNEYSRKHYFHNQVVNLARKHKYYADIDRYHSWVRMTIKTEEKFEFIVSIHGYGSFHLGVMSASAFTALRVEKEDGGTEPVSVYPASIDLFQFNYAEPLDGMSERFRDWLESALAMALGEWKRIIAA